MKKIHRSVLAAEVTELWQAYLHPERDQLSRKDPRAQSLQPIEPPAKPLLVDATLGEAGHAKAMLSAAPHSRLIGIDADPQMLERAKYFLEDDLARCQLQNSRFIDFFRQQGTPLNADIILFDLGISLFHYTAEAGRGFSFRPEDESEELDMRLNPDSGIPSAADLIMGLRADELADIFFYYGEIFNARSLARRICEQREQRNLRIAKELADLIWQTTPPKQRHKRIHPATKVFQALRIAVNHELDQLEEVLPLALKQLKQGALLAVISFHSLEDRIVKQVFRQWQEEEKVTWVYKKAISPSKNEQEEIPSSRSAKLRVVRKLPLPYS